MKDPAFLFYSKEFYEGTRMMYPNERACYIDLMIYQHQNGIIPDDTNRLLMYCSGVNEATLKAVLKAKFKQTDSGWLNDKLQHVIEERQEYALKQSSNGRIGQFWKKAKALLSNKEYNELKKNLKEKPNNEIFNLIENKEINKATLEAVLKASLKHYTITDSDSILNLDFIPDEYRNIVNIWLNYKKSKKQSYANNESIKAMFENLLQLSGNNPQTAELIIKQSMANSWAGLFELKTQNKNGKDIDFDRLFKGIGETNQI